MYIDTGVPSPPTNLVASTSDTMRLQWSPPMDDGGANVTGYIIFVENMTETWNSTVASIELNITAGTFLVHVKAVNCAGYSDSASMLINFNLTGIAAITMYNYYYHIPNIVYRWQHLRFLHWWCYNYGYFNQ